MRDFETHTDGTVLSLSVLSQETLALFYWFFTVEALIDGKIK